MVQPVWPEGQQPQAQVQVASQDDSVEIKDFTVKRKRIKFKIDDDIFEASTILSLPTMQSMVALSKELSDMVEKQNFEGITRTFNELLIDTSAKRFNERVMSRGDDAIDVRNQLIPVLYYLMESFGLRPTQLSSDSSAGSPSGPDGTTSTVGSSTEVSYSNS